MVVGVATVASHTFSIETKGNEEKKSHQKKNSEIQRCKSI